MKLSIYFFLSCDDYGEVGIDKLWQDRGVTFIDLMPFKCTIYVTIAVLLFYS